MTEFKKSFMYGEVAESFQALKQKAMNLSKFKSGVISKTLAPQGFQCFLFVYLFVYLFVFLISNNLTVPQVSAP